MRTKRFSIGAAIALSIVASSANAQSAAPLSIAASVQRSAAQPDQPQEQNDLAGRYGWLLPAILVAAAIAAVVFLSIDDDDPTSP